MRQHYPAIILAVFLTGLIFYNSPPRYKVLADETNLMGTSMLMHHSREAALPVECVYAKDDFPIYSKSDSKRPFLFPFLLSLLHSVLGYSPSNGFVLNFFVSIGALFGTYLTVFRLKAKSYALISMILMAGTPIYMICFTSSGFEPLNLMFVIYCVFLFTFVLDSNSSPRHVEFLFLTMLLLAHCRYESVIFIPVMGIMIISFSNRYLFLKNMSYCIVVMPILLLPVLWQRKFFMGGQALINRLDAHSFEQVDIGFTIKDFVQNFDDNIFVLMGINPNYGFSAIIFVLALIGIYLLVQRQFRTPNRGDINSVLVINITVFFILFLIISSFHWGNFGLAMDNRLSLVFLPFMVWAATYCLSRVEILYKGRWVYFAGFLAVLHFFFFLPYGTKEKLIKNLSLSYEYHMVSNYLENHFHDRENTLIITEQPNLYVIHGYGCIRFVNFNDYIKNQSKYIKSSKVVAVHKIIRSRKNTSHEKWKDFIIKADTLTVIPISKDVSILIEAWQFAI